MTKEGGSTTLEITGHWGHKRGLTTGVLPEGGSLGGQECFRFGLWDGDGSLGARQSASREAFFSLVYFSTDHKKEKEDYLGSGHCRGEREGQKKRNINFFSSTPWTPTLPSTGTAQ